MEPNNRFDSQESEQEYRRRQAAKEKRRKKRRTQRLLLLGAFAVAALLLILCIVMIFRAIFGEKEPVSSSVPSSSSSVSVPTSGPGVSWPVAADPTVWNLILVNGQFPLPDGFTVETATVTSIGHTFDARAADALKRMVEDCNAVSGNSLAIYSGYRGATTQNERYNYQVNLFKGQGHGEAEAQQLARQVELPAGYGEHQTGLAVDFTTGTVQEPSINFAQTPEFAWLVENAKNYGFILRYPSEQEAITGIKVQPYHFRYVGVEDAVAITEAGICLEQYLAVTTQGSTSTDVPTDSGAGAGSTSAGSDGSNAA